jgi:hypothetical protein
MLSTTIIHKEAIKGLLWIQVTFPKLLTPQRIERMKNTLNGYGIAFATLEKVTDDKAILALVFSPSLFELPEKHQVFMCAMATVSKIMDDEIPVFYTLRKFLGDLGVTQLYMKGDYPLLEESNGR